MSTLRGGLFVPGALPVYVRTHVHEESVGRHDHDFYELVLMESGYSLHESEGARCVLTAGDLIGIAPGVSHTYSNPFRAHIFNCIFTSEAIEGCLPPEEELDVLNLVFCRPRPRRLHPDGDAKREMVRLLRGMCREFDARAVGWQQKMRGQLAVLLISVARQYALAPAANADTPYQPTGVVYRALHALEDRSAEQVRISDLARENGLSTDYFSRLFKEQVGMGPTEYLRVLRIGRACQLLADTDLPIWAVAGKVGFPDENYFARVFRQVTGESPSAWRAAERGNVL